MKPAREPQAARRWLPVGAAWAAYLPVGAQYVGYLLLATLALMVLGQRRPWPAIGPTSALGVLLAFCAWAAISAAWSSAPSREIVSHLWSYSMLLWVVPIALVCDQADAARGVRHFLYASTLVALAHAVGSIDPIPDWYGWRALFEVTGNRRIAMSLLLALATALAVLHGLDGRTRRHKALWLTVALLCAVGLACQDRRSGMVALPVLLALIAWIRLRRWRGRVPAIAAIVGLALLASMKLDGVQGRFNEGVDELQAFQAGQHARTSWGMRAQMLETTLEMIGDRPFFGLGLGGWSPEWRQRVKGEALQGHRTPHSEYLLIAAQSGLLGLALAIAALARAAVSLARWGPAAHGAMVALTLFATAAAFNTALRDTRFALPCLVLLALTSAAGRPLAVPSLRPRG